MSDSELLDLVKSLSQKVEEMQGGDDLEREFEIDEPKKHSQMLDLDPERTDSFGDSIELVTKSRLADNSESYQIAKSFVRREYHNMIGNRYGKHSKLIPVYDDNGEKTKIDMVWFSGCDVKIVEIADHDGNVRQFYKVRLLVYDILTKKLLLARIPTSDGAARQEEIQHMGAGRGGEQWLKEYGGLNAMKPLKYSGSQGKTTMKQVGEVVFE